MIDLLELLTTKRLLAIVRGDNPEAALASIQTLVENGIDLIEVSLTSADALGVIAKACQQLGDRVTLGAGTVVDADDARQAQNAGASFVVSPGITDGAAEAIRLGIPTLAGAFTPTEIAIASRSGAVAVKLFPASLGGPAYLRAVRAPFPEIPFVPVGGVDAASARQYLQAGAVAVGVGSPLLGDAPDGGDQGGLRPRAQQFRSLMAEALVS